MPSVLGQTKLAETFAAVYQGRHIHVHGLGWFYWDGCRWAEDAGDARARRSLLKAFKALWKLTFRDPELLKSLTGCFSNGGQNGALGIAAILPEFSRDLSDLDANPYLLNTPSGTYDLLTGETKPHDPADLITKVTRGGLGSTTGLDEWEKFLAVVLPDTEVRGYLQRLIGISLLGLVREHVLGILYGPEGQNGKSTFYEAVLHALGDYGHKAESDLLMKAKTNANSASPAVFALFGKRLLVCSETEEGETFAVAMMKSLTGGDTLRARPVYGKPFEFAPTHTALLVTNHLPKVKADESAAWRRLRVIPFTVRIPDAIRDPLMGERLRLSSDAVVAWAVQGWLDYMERGMDEPASVLLATQEYRDESDIFGRFVADRLEKAAGHREPRSLIWDAYVEHCRAEDENPGTPASFYKLMARMFKETKYNGVRCFADVRLTDEFLVDAVLTEAQEASE